MDTTSLLDAMRLGKPEDLYYYTSDTTKKQSIATLVDNRFQYGLSQLGQGSSTIILSPDQGISDIILAMKLPAQGAGQSVSGTANYAGLALPRGWGYSMLSRVSARYAGSSQYFWTGSQVMLQNLREASNPVARDQLFYLGGSALAGAAAGAGDFVGDNLWAYLYLNLPHCSPNGSAEKPKPFPSELLTMPIVITIEMVNPSTVFSSAVAGGSVAGAPVQLEFGSVQIRQVHARDRGQLMTPSSDSNKGYSLPIIFYQNQIDIPVVADAVSGSASVTLTGMRAGDMTHIIAWLTDNADTNPNRAAPFVYQPFKFAQIYDPTILYNGTVYFTAKNEASRLWNLVSTDVQAELPGVALALGAGPTAGTVVLSEPDLVTWLEVPFGQIFEQISATHTLVHGLPVSNAVINMNLTVPNPAHSYTLHVVYVMNSVLFISRGNVEYAF